MGRVRYWWKSKNKRIRHGRYKYYKPHLNHGSLCVFDDANPHTRIKILVMETFVGPCPDGYKIVHLNEDPEDCRLVNLAYAPRQEIKISRKRLSKDQKDRLVNRWESIKRNNLRISIDRLAREEGVSVRSLYRVLREYDMAQGKNS